MRTVIKLCVLAITATGMFPVGGQVLMPVCVAQGFNYAQAGTVAQSRQYVLQTGNLQSSASFDGITLLVNDGARIYSYSRMETLDSSDGQYWGFYNQELDKTIRFPIAQGGRVQLEGAYGNWKYSKMTVTLLPAAVSPTSPAQAVSVHDQIDNLALEIQQQAKGVSFEVDAHYRNTPEYWHLSNHCSELRQRSAHLHELAHNHGDFDKMAADLKLMDGSFHHFEETFERVEADANRGIGKVVGHTAHVREQLNSMEQNLHELLQVVTAQQRHVVLKPAFGDFSDVDELAERLEKEANELLLDLHYNYSHNKGYKTTYKEAYSILEVAKKVHSFAHGNDRVAIQRQLVGLDQLTLRIEDDIRWWSRNQIRQVGVAGANEKLNAVTAIVAALMDDAGVHRTQIAPTPPNKPEVAPKPW